MPVLLFKKNMVSTIHDLCCLDCPETMSWYSKWYFLISHRIALLKCNNIITISRYSKERIAKRLKYPRNKIWLIYCGVDDKFAACDFNKRNKDEIKEKYHLPDKYILSLSTLEPRKNLHLLIESYQKMVVEKKCDIPLVLAGRKGWKIDKLLEGVNEQTKNNIIFTGFIDDEDLPCIYREATFFVFPSKYEGFGLPPLEAMACGTPVLSSDAASMPEILGDAACYFHNDNVDDLSGKIQEMLAMSEETRVDMISRGLNQAKRFTWAKAAKQLIKILLE